MSLEKKIVDPLLIAPIFREVMLLELPLFCGSKTLRIKRIEDATNRRNDARIKILLDSPVDANVDRIEIQFRRRVVSFRPSVIEEEGLIYLLLPDEVTVVNRRSSNRSRNTAENKEYSSMVIEKGSFSFEVKCHLTDYNSSGVGFDFARVGEFSIDEGDIVKGRYSTGFGYLDVHAKITWVRDDSDEVLHFGATFVEPISKNLSHIERAERVSSRFVMNLIDGVGSEGPLECEVKNMSISGALLVPINIERAKGSLKVGSTVKVADELLIGEICRVEEDSSFALQWVFSSDESRNEWLTSVLPLINDGALQGTANRFDVFEMICESGALGSEYIQNERVDIAVGNTDVDSNSDDQLSYHFKRFDQGNDGVKGQASLLSLGDNTWIVSDVAGGRTEETRLSEDFVGETLRRFLEINERATPSPKVLIMWIEGHKFWSKFDRYLLQSKKFFALGQIGYVRTVGESWLDFQGVEINQILPTDYDIIERSLSSLDINSRYFLKALNFQCDSFGSPLLSRRINDNNWSFARSYFRISAFSREFICVVSKYPIGLNLNKIAESCWVFQVSGSRNLDDVEFIKIKGALKKYAIERGFNFPSIRRLLTESDGILENEIRMEWRLIHLDSLRFFGGKR